MPSKSAYLIAGASGSHPFETPAEYVTSDGGIVLTSEYPAGYKFYVINAYNGYDIEVDATIEVTKSINFYFTNELQIAVRSFFTS